MLFIILLMIINLFLILVVWYIYIIIVKKFKVCGQPAPQNTQFISRLTFVLLLLELEVKCD